MLDLDYEKKKFIAKLETIKEEKSVLIEKADNYEELHEIYGTKDNIDSDELEWDNDNLRAYELLIHNEWIYEKLVTTINDIQSAGDDKKAIHRNNKGIETLITSIKGIKQESEDIISKEQEMIDEANAALEFLSFVREK